MRLILITFVISALSLYIYIDYDNIKRKMSGESVETVKLNVENVSHGSTESKSEKTNEKTHDEEIDSKFKENDVVYIDASVGDTMTFQQNEVRLWKTYEGSDNDDYQGIKRSIPHQMEVRIISIREGSDGVIWYHIRTAKGLPTTGWVQEKYLSRELPKRRKGRDSDWGL